MSKIEVNAIEPQSGTSLTLGASGDTITIPSGATLTNSGTATGFGKVLQVVSATTTTQTTTTSTSFQSTNIAVDIDAKAWPKSDLAWINSPSNPTGRVHSESELEAVIGYARVHNTVVASDECYINYQAIGP